MNYKRNKIGEFTYKRGVRRFFRELFSWRTLIKFWIGTFITAGSIFAYTLLLDAPSYILPVEAQTAQISQNIAPEMTLYDHICNATNGENCDVLYNLAKCESSLNKDAFHVNTNGTVDLGLFQINSVHKDISSSEKLDVYASSRWANEKIKAGQGNIWVCWDKI